MPPTMPSTILQTLDRKKKKEWKRNGKSEKYQKIKKEFDDKYKKAASSYLTKCVTDLKNEQPGKAAATLKRMGAQPGEPDGSTFTLLNHISESLSVEEQVSRLSDYFIAVSQEFPPLSMDQLSTETIQKIENISNQDIPKVEEHQIFQILDKAKKKKSSVPGDMPPKLFYDASAALAVPAAKIMNRIAQTGKWPTQYQTEWGVPLEKVKNAKDESEVRLISCTNKMNIVFEKQVVKWLMDATEKTLDPDQFGGRKGNSISHYLIEMTNFILYNQDLKNPQATLATFIDYRQGFNRCQHSIFIEILSKDYGIPGWLLRILVGYLTGRKLAVRYKGLVGEKRDIFGGGGQGSPLGMWIFLFMIDRAGPKANEISIGKTITQPLNRRKRIEKDKKKWVDDFTILTAVDLKKDLITPRNSESVRPVPYRSRTGHILPLEANPLQIEVDAVKKYSDERKMLLNPIKTKTMIFNTLKNYDVLPIIHTDEGKELEVVEEHKILGHIIRSDMRSISNTKNICKKAYTRMWFLRRLSSLGCPQNELIEVLKQQIVSVCEVGVPFWAPMITVSESNMLERCLKTGLHIILQDKYVSFGNALKISKMQSLKNRRAIQMTKFAKQALASEKHSTWFEQSGPKTEMLTRNRNVPILKQVQCRTQKYAHSSIPVLTKILSWHPPMSYTPVHLV